MRTHQCCSSAVAAVDNHDMRGMMMTTTMMMMVAITMVMTVMRVTAGSPANLSSADRGAAHAKLHLAIRVRLRPRASLKRILHKDTDRNASVPLAAA